MNRRVVLAFALLAVWLLLGPVAMAFDGCMGCELPCAQMACAVPSPALTLEREAVTSSILQVELHPATTTPSTLELPPKHLLSAA
jgi:hypothetical protein